MARTAELRAAAALARLTPTDETRGALATLVDSFAEGLATADLRDARNVLI
jgi:predicted ATPase